MEQFVRKAVDCKVWLLATDEHSGYRLLDKDYKHESVRHGKGEKVRGLVDTSTIDSFWSLWKRGIMGEFHHVSEKYLPLYLTEFSYRYNRRNNPNIFRQTIAGC